LSVTDTITGEILLLPGVEKADQGPEDFELRVGGKAFAHVHGSDRIDVRLPQDVKEGLIAQGLVSRTPESHDKEGWVILRLEARPNMRVILRVLQTAYKHTSSIL
jgi:Family of unknown function (DUF5519)